MFEQSILKLNSILVPLGVPVLCVTLTATIASAQTAVADLAHSTDLIERLENTKLLNENEIYERLKLVGSKTRAESNLDPGSSRRFLTANPYHPRYQESFKRFADVENRLPRNALSFQFDKSKSRFKFFGQKPVFEWYSSLTTNTQVCAAKLTDKPQKEYELRTFSNSPEAIAAEYVVTHRYHCGTCSSLRNLAVYLTKRDLTTPVRSCARKLTLRGIKSCLIESIGVQERCAETWAYNVAHTKRQCMRTCIKHYGLWNVLRNNMGDEHVDDEGELNPCLACDEHISGPGFQYAAGRTRRASGLTSAIERTSAEVYPVDHSLYFE